MCFSILSFRAWYGVVVCAGSVRLLDAHAVLGSGGTAEPGRSSGDGAALLKLRAGMTHWEIADQQAFGGNGVPSGYLPTLPFTYPTNLRRLVIAVSVSVPTQPISRETFIALDFTYVFCCAHE